MYRKPKQVMLSRDVRVRTNPQYRTVIVESLPTKDMVVFREDEVIDLAKSLNHLVQCWRKEDQDVVLEGQQWMQLVGQC